MANFDNEDINCMPKVIYGGRCRRIITHCNNYESIIIIMFAPNLSLCKTHGRGRSADGRLGITIKITTTAVSSAVTCLSSILILKEKGLLRPRPKID